MVRISENQQFSDFLRFSREIPVPFSTVSKFSEVEVERSESALGKLVPTKQRIVYSFIGSYTRGGERGWGGVGVLNKVLYDSLPFYIAFFKKKVPLSHTLFRTLHPS